MLFMKNRRLQIWIIWLAILSFFGGTGIHWIYNFQSSYQTEAQVKFNP